ncbi:hypothetical protein ASPWEDRAFT_472858 [Aspergillus wentii DTO 134E9]|uniref:Uncharacterized protein n=1 Tax=Aspergillus wentii DTO 134E9 TaxID=1073089 RepID=A0A1L9RSZ2_ASPWE|nr:uncharacterized protein ASPWEDRAFT_472858 [Aspergillus wentii DTO 134E9]OJJ37968.1 hypothetical protein ASPWEDRAFT_472858 [Aspergillus wentii DTO 134E9]
MENGNECMSWTDGTIETAIHQYFSHPPKLDDTSITLEKSFTAYNLESFTGIAIHWTDNIADHLRLVEDDKKVVIFHHVTFLECQRTSLFPPGLVNETLRTISLLFPQCDDKNRKWFKKRHFSSEIDVRLLRCGYLNHRAREIDQFHFWKDRLIILKEKFDHAHPQTISQWWRDRRNRVQWYTFWLAVAILILTIFFGFVQSVEGALQVYKAFNPN